MGVASRWFSSEGEYFGTSLDRGLTETQNVHVLIY